MKTVFELNNGLPFDRTLFERMQKTASDILNNATKEEYTQAIVLLTSKGKEYCAVIENECTNQRVSVLRDRNQMDGSGKSGSIVSNNC